MASATANSIVFEERLRVPMDVCDLQRFRAWAHSRAFPETGRISYLAGEIDVDMSPEEIESHNKVKRDIIIGLSAYLAKADFGELLIDGALLVNEDADLATEPDILFCSWDSLRSGRVKYAEWVAGSDRLVEVSGSPDLVVEIISRYSVRKDTKRLPTLYFNAGIEEYWLIDARGADIQLSLHVRGKKKYRVNRPDADGFCRSGVLGARFRLTRDRNPVGGFRYSLESR